ncbi:MAG: SgcJ/EcaC family oxidoreductase [Thermoguttaceae bacterium]
MRHLTLSAVYWTAILTAIGASAAADPNNDAIREISTAFERASNRHDAKAVAALFTADGELVNAEGRVVQGQKNLEQTFAAIFEAQPKLQVHVAVQSIRTIAPTVAIEDGESTLVRQPGQQGERNRYTVVYVQQDGRWRMASARDLPPSETSDQEELKSLAWLIGQWVNESPQAAVFTTYRWAADGHAILGEFQIQVAGRPAMTGTHRIGWDPSIKKIRSWTFDSDGGAAEGVWTRDGNRWLVKMTGVRRDGETASATNVLTQVTKDRMTWQSRDRVVGDRVSPEAKPIVIVRKPPQPGQSVPSEHHHSTGDAQ